MWPLDEIFILICNSVQYERVPGRGRPRARWLRALFYLPLLFMLFDSYNTGGFYDEMFRAERPPQASARVFVGRINSVGDEDIRRYQKAAEQLLFRMGITFNVYGDAAGTEKIFPFDIIPRIVPADEWVQIDRGLRQRVHALNLFIDDIYHD